MVAVIVIVRFGERRRRVGIEMDDLADRDEVTLGGQVMSSVLLISTRLDSI